ncbi:hypothetical protein HPG69_019689 [Diceros bicornis minor]|uniref:Uncharacterized protein n=1 Tax=Diceros bicornis minor TaxID=77932 RepID=A0A7J7E6J3_DICBM|nr:hypothetical protein HPG69_019689 [Diceros bicornis minor]
MRLSVRALRSSRPELFVNYISGAFIAPEPPATEKPPPPPQTASRAPGAPASPGLAAMAALARRSQALRPGIWRPRRAARTQPGRYAAAARASPSPKRQPYLLWQSCTLFPRAAALRASWGHGSPGDRRPTGQPRRVPALTGPARGLPAALCPGPAGAPLPAPPSPAPGLSVPPGRSTPAVPDAGRGPEGAGPR